MDLKQQIILASWVTCGLLTFIWMICKFKQGGEKITIGGLGFSFIGLLSGCIGFATLVIYHLIEWDGWDDFWNIKLF